MYRRCGFWVQGSAGVMPLNHNVKGVFFLAPRPLKILYTLVHNSPHTFTEPKRPAGDLS